MEKQGESCSMSYSGIGGQAVMEGVMMRNKEKYAVAVRDPKGQIRIKSGEYKGILPFPYIYKIPFIRGIFSFIDSMVLGMKTLNYSADVYAEEEGKGIENSKKGSFSSALVMVVAILMAVGLFMVLPFYMSLLFKGLIGEGRLLSLVEGGLRILIFIGYVLSVSQLEDIKRVFMYHGAEHKCINCIESGNPLNIENVRASSKEHRRCGTSFMLYVMVVSIVLFSFIKAPDPLTRAALRVALVPVVAGIAYELIRLAGRSNNALVRAMSAPGLWMQALTTKEPDDKMIEVGIQSVEAVFDWKKYQEEEFK